MSDDYLRLIPADLNWQPTPEAAAAAAAYVARLFSAPDDDVESVDSLLYDWPVGFARFDLGTCSACSDIPQLPRAYFLQHQ